jgi:hypothetical protein
MERAPHFVQAAGQPIFIGQGAGLLTCRCGQSELVRGYDPKNFLAVDLQCASCGAVTTTPGLSALNNPPAVVVPLERTAETPPEGASLAPGHVLAGREELDRLMHIYQPRSPVSDSVSITMDWLDAVGADYDRLTGGLLATHLKEIALAEAEKPLSGLARHKLAWALHTLRAGVADRNWTCWGSSSASVATTTACAFRYFTDCWSHHPLFPEMAAAAADTGFSLHGAALFATAKALSDSGNRIAFLPPRDGSGRVKDFVIAMGPSDQLTCVMDRFDQYEWPPERRWTFPDLRAAVQDRLLASKGRIHQKRPGMIVLSPGPTREAIEQPLVDAIFATFHTHGRRYRHVSAVSVILAKIMATQERHTVRFGYSFLPIANPKHAAVTVQVAEPQKVTG